MLFTGESQPEQPVTYSVSAVGLPVEVSPEDRGRPLYLDKELSQGRCPDCAGAKFLAGPRGGESQNWQCAGCGHRFNIVIWKRRFVWAQRL